MLCISCDKQNDDYKRKAMKLCKNAIIDYFGDKNKSEYLYYAGIQSIKQTD